MVPREDIPHELSFAKDLSSVADAVLAAEGNLPFTRSAIEVSARGRITRRDFTLYGEDGRPVLTGELKLPYMPDGRSPYNFAVVEDAAAKAVDAGVRYFFTWNVNTFVLWDLQQAGKPLIHRDQEKIDVADVESPDELGDAALLRRIEDFWRKFLPRFAGLLTGQAPLKSRSLDERFIDILDSALNSPAMIIRSAVGYSYQTDAAFRRRLNGWMTRHGMSILGQEMSGNIQRTAKIAAYVLASRLMFYKALHRRFKDDLRPLRIPSAVTTAVQLQERLSRYFRDAEKATGDYETIFEGDELVELAFITDDLVPAWRGLLEDIEGFDFTELDYDLIGPIFERLIAPAERHRWGQHYTKPEVCDIINAFVIRKPEDAVLDPACGGGTFLVRAYARKAYLARRLGRDISHQVLLSQINGTDISLYAAHIATVNMASRRLQDEANYPRVAATDFFDVTPVNATLHVPNTSLSSGRVRRSDRLTRPMPNTAIGCVDAVIGNPPYIRQEKLGERYKAKIATRAAQSKVPMPHVPGRSDIHLSFWAHSASFIRDEGRIGLLTSSNWLDTDYGVALQKWMLGSFRIVAILESAVEPWFTGARVATAVTILERETDASAREGNLVRFVRFQKPLTDLLGTAATDDDQLQRSEDLVAELLAAGTDLATPEYMLRLVRQSELQAGQEGGGAAVGGVATLFGTKWGAYLRGPSFLFEVLSRFDDHFVRLGVPGVAEVRFGVKSGADEFFFVRDVTDEWLSDRPTAIKSNFGIDPRQTDKIRLVAATNGTVHPIEARFLVPEVHRLAEVTRIDVDPAAMPRRMVSISEPLDNLKGPHAAAYIRWGQRRPHQYHKRSTCSAREPWYDVTGFDTPTILWSMSHKYRHLAPYNLARVVPNHNLFGIRAASGVDDAVLCAVLNSTLVGWIKCFVSRPMGTEGFKTEVVDVKSMPIPDPRRVTPEVGKRLLSAFDRMRGRETQNLVDELELDDRKDLDDAVFELIGVTSEQERLRLRATLYDATRSLYGSLRHVEVQATRNRSRTARRSKVTPHDIAMEIWDRMDRSSLRRFPDTFLPVDSTTAMEVVQVPARVSHVEVGNSLFTIPGEGAKATRPGNGDALATGTILVNDESFALGHVARAEYLKAALQAGHVGSVKVPLDESVCSAAVQAYRQYRIGLKKLVKEQAEEHAGSRKLAEQVASHLEAMCLKGYGGPSWIDQSPLGDHSGDEDFDD